MEEKIQKARRYVELVGCNATEELLMLICNDASNIFADSFEEYAAIYEALRRWRSLR